MTLFFSLLICTQITHCYLCLLNEIKVLIQTCLTKQIIILFMWFFFIHAIAILCVIRKMWCRKIFKYCIFLCLLCLLATLYQLYSNGIYTYDRCANYTSIKSNHEAIHIAIITAKYQQNLQLYLMLKSILLKRSKHLHFHVLVDDKSTPSFIATKTLFNSWNIHNSKVSYYNDTVCNSKINLATLNDEDNLYEISKIVLSKIIPSNITDSIIVLNTNLIFNVDIYEVWAAFKNYSMYFDIGLISKKFLTTSILETKEKFNTDIIFFNLKNLRNIDCDLVYNYVSNSQKSTNFNTETDTNGLREILKLRYENVFFDHNIQLIETDFNFGEINKIKVVQNVNLGTITETMLYSIYKNVLQLNGNFLRDSTYSNYLMPYKAENVETETCKKYDKNIGLNRRILLYFQEFDYIPSEDDITFASQISYERVPLIESVAKLWVGPLSITLYITDDQLYNFTTFINNSEVLKKRKNIIINLMFIEGGYYPINDLRNVSLRTVITPYVYLIDMDVLPPPNLYNRLKRHVNTIGSMDKKALIVPVFQGNLTKIPKTKYQIKKLLKLSKIQPFHQEFPPAYGPTNYAKWVIAKHPYQVKYQVRYEPYVVVQKNIPEYDRHFIQFGFDKASHILHLAANNFSFIVLHDVFSVHKYHEKSWGEKEDKKLGIFARCKKYRMIKFIALLNIKCNTSFFL